MIYCEVNKVKCLSNLSRLNYPSDLGFDIGRLYSYKGKDFYYEDVLKSELDSRIKNNPEKDKLLIQYHYRKGYNLCREIIEIRYYR